MATKSHSLPSKQTYNFPRNVCLGPSKHVFFSDDNRVLYAMPGQAKVYVSCGSEESGFVNGAACDAKFSAINGLAFSASGDLYIADSGNNCIRVLKKNGMVQTFAGSGKKGHKDGAREKSRFRAPHGLCFDAFGNLLVADYDNNAIRKINMQTGTVRTFIGNVPLGPRRELDLFAPLFQPRSLCYDSCGQLYVLCRQSGSDVCTTLVIHPNGRVSVRRRDMGRPESSEALQVFFSPWLHRLCHVITAPDGPVSAFTSAGFGSHSVMPISGGTGDKQWTNVLDKERLAKRNAKLTADKVSNALKVLWRLLQPDSDLESSCVVILEAENQPDNLSVTNLAYAIDAKSSAFSVLTHSNLHVAWYLARPKELVMLDDEGEIIWQDQRLLPILKRYNEKLQKNENPSYIHMPLILRVTYARAHCIVQVLDYGSIKTIICEIDNGFSVENVARKIKQSHGLTLSLSITEIKDREDEGDSIIYLNGIVTVPLDVKVQYNGKVTDVLVSVSETFTSLVQRLSAQLGFPENARLLFNDVPVYLPRYVAELPLKSGDLLVVQPRDSSAKLWMRTLTGKVFELPGYQPQDYIYDIMAHVERIEGTCTARQRVIFAGAQLEPQRTISDYNITDQCTLSLVLRIRGG